MKDVNRLPPRSVRRTWTKDDYLAELRRKEPVKRRTLAIAVLISCVELLITAISIIAPVEWWKAYLMTHVWCLLVVGMVWSLRQLDKD